MFTRLLLFIAVTASAALSMAADAAPAGPPNRKDVVQAAAAEVPPKELRKCVIAAQKDFHIEGATATLEGDTIRITVATKEAKLPDSTCCLFLYVSPSANLPGVGKLVSTFGRTGVIGFTSDACHITTISKEETATPDGTSIFEGRYQPLGGNQIDLSAVDWWVAIQLCTDHPKGGQKAASNAVWIKAQPKR